METLKQNWKRYLVSSLVTFFAGFVAVLVAQIESLQLSSLTDGTLVGLLFLGVRTGLKLMLEYILSLLIKK